MLALALAALLPAFAAPAAPEDSDGKHEALVRRLVEGFVNTGDAAALDDVLAPNFRRFGPGTVALHGRDEFEMYVRSLRTRFPDFHLAIQDLDIDGDVAWVRVQATATSGGAEPGSAGRRVTGPATSFFRFANGRIVEQHVSFDTIDIGRQLGLEPQPPASERNRETARRVIEEFFNQGRVELADELFAAEYRNHAQPDDGLPSGPEGMKERVRRLRQAFPDVRLTIENMIAEGDTISARVTLRGTHKGEFLGLAPTHRSIAVTSVGMHEFVDGKVVASWRLSDLAEALRQAGAQPVRHDGR